MQVRRRVTAVDTSNPMNLFADEAVCQGQQGKGKAPGGVTFNRPDPHEIFLGAVRLDEHLKAMGTSDALPIRGLLQEQSWEAFEQHYKPGGRPPYAPEAMLGLIVYGLLKGVSSLRGLEELARVDLGCMWITGGLCPDHASIGRFVQRHDGEITADLPDLLADVQADVVLLAASEVSNPELVLGILDEVEAEVMTMALIDTRTCDCFPQTRILLEDHADVVVSIPYRFDRVLQNLDIPETSP